MLNVVFVGIFSTVYSTFLLVTISLSSSMYVAFAVYVSFLSHFIVIVYSPFVSSTGIIVSLFMFRFIDPVFTSIFFAFVTVPCIVISSSTYTLSLFMLIVILCGCTSYVVVAILLALYIFSNPAYCTVTS